MSSSLIVTTQLDNFQKVVTVTVQPGSNLPLDIFAYENTGSTELGKYIGVVDLEEYGRLRTFVGDSIPTFANRFVKYTQAKIILDIDTDPTNVIDHVVETSKNLLFSINNAPTTVQTITL